MTAPPALFHNRCLEAERRGAPLPEMQQMWIISPGRPEVALHGCGCQPVPGLPPGFHAMAPWFATGIVVLSELPRTPDTILLRLLGSPRMRQEALSEVRALAEGSAERTALISTISKARFMIEREPGLPREAKEEFMTAIQAEFERFKQSLIEQGVEEGMEKGMEKGREALAQAVLLLLDLRGLTVPEDVRSRVLSCADLAALRRWHARALKVSSAEDIFAG